MSLHCSEVTEELEGHEYDSEGDDEDQQRESSGQQQHFYSLKIILQLRSAGSS